MRDILSITSYGAAIQDGQDNAMDVEIATDHVYDHSKCVVDQFHCRQGRIRIAGIFLNGP